MADYSEFPTTPTGWQERQLTDWQEVTPLATEDVEPPRRSVDMVALVAGLVFVTLAILGLAGLELPFLFRDGGVLWVLLIGVGVVLLVKELRRTRRKH